MNTLTVVLVLVTVAWLGSASRVNPASSASRAVISNNNDEDDNAGFLEVPAVITYYGPSSVVSFSHQQQLGADGNDLEADDGDRFDESTARPDNFQRGNVRNEFTGNGVDQRINIQQGALLSSLQPISSRIHQQRQQLLLTRGDDDDSGIITSRRFQQQQQQQQQQQLLRANNVNNGRGLSSSDDSTSALFQQRFQQGLGSYTFFNIGGNNQPQQQQQQQQQQAQVVSSRESSTEDADDQQLVINARRRRPTSGTTVVTAGGRSIFGSSVAPIGIKVNNLRGSLAGSSEEEASTARDSSEEVVFNRRRGGASISNNIKGGYRSDSDKTEGDLDSTKQYSFAYQVRDDETLNYQSRREQHDGRSVQGVYSVLDSDGHLRTVRYGDNGAGFFSAILRQPTNLVSTVLPVINTSAGRHQQVAGRVPTSRLSNNRHSAFIRRDSSEEFTDERRQHGRKVYYPL